MLYNLLQKSCFHYFNLQKMSKSYILWGIDKRRGEKECMKKSMDKTFINFNFLIKFENNHLYIY